MKTRTSWNKILTWSIAWGVTGIALFSADVFSVPRNGPLWIGIVLGLVSWSVAGALTFPHARPWRSLTVWALAYLLAFWLGALWGDWFEHNTIGSISSAGFVGALLGWAAGASFGVLASEYFVPTQLRHTNRFVHAIAWGISFLIGGYVALILSGFLAQLAALAFPFAEQIALYIGWAFGCALGGALASGLALNVRSITRSALLSSSLMRRL